MMYRLKNPLQHYAWGSHTAIQGLLGLNDQEPVAEMWMGAHPKAPSIVQHEDGDISLATIIDQDPTSMLGRSVAERFANRLPFLFKLLAADKCLSLQTHPNLEQAQAGFARENNLSIPIDAPHRNYRDANHKPEIICAISEFWGLNGFRPLDDMMALLNSLRLPAMADELAMLQAAPSRDTLRHVFGRILKLDAARRHALVQDLLTESAKRRHERAEFEWMQRIHQDYPHDPGILCVLLLNLVHLQPGQAMYCGAGNLHAYLHGFGVELMANSDNVLRGGLTVKHVDPEELLNVLTFDCQQATIVEPKVVSETEDQYPTPNHEFDLRRIHLEPGIDWKSASDRSLEILICLEGLVSLELDGNQLVLKAGQSAMLAASAAAYRLTGHGIVFKAGAPIS
ncbi:MAG: mannose-6-phosphate isomerase, class I [bacterium]|nr:mannose-6-phosphate isomerase, class I [bacterium]